MSIGGLVPVCGGLAGMILGARLTGDGAASPDLDSHVRYLSGLLFAIGLGFWSTVPGIGARSARFGLLTALVLCGGLGRLAGLFLAGPPSAAMRAALVMELLVTPALFLWQRHLAR